tara:strand:+ start:22521 stop:22733 length:213 start_codon:yes stop_codon:yes gene_type:complete
MNAFENSWNTLKSDMSDIASLVDEIRMLVENQNAHPIIAARMVAEANYPGERDQRKMGRMLFQAYVNSMS